MATEIKCVIIGDVNRASEVAKTLSTSGVPAIALAHNAGFENLALRCAKERSLRVVGVYCKDFPMDHGAGLFRALRKEFKGRPVSLHAFFESQNRGAAQSAAIGVVRELRGADVDEIFFAFPLDVYRIASVLKQKWFPKAREITRPRDLDSEEAEPAVATAAQSRVPARAPVPVRRPVAPSASPPAEQPAPRRVLQVVPTKAPPLLDAKKAADELLEGLKAFVSMKSRSPQYPEVPVPQNIVGKHHQVLFLDPRRIRPLSDQPRSIEKSPGFSESSLRDLGENIRIFGQTDDILVCPIVGDPDYDAQLIDGERRCDSTKLVGLMVRVKVTEDVTPEDTRKLYLLSVIRNGQKEPHTTPEYMRMVQRLRGEEYRMTRKQVAAVFAKSETWVIQMEMLGTLDESVQDMLEVREDQEEVPKSRTPRRLTAQIALQLVDLEPAMQLKTAKNIVEKGMNLGQAKRYVRAVRRGEGLSSGGRSSSPAREFDALATFVRQSLTSLDTYLDTPTAEFYSENRTAGQRQGLCRDLADASAKCLELKVRLEKYAE